LPASAFAGLLSYAVSRMVIQYFPTDVGSSKTKAGRIHIILASLSFGGIAAGVAFSTPVILQTAGWFHSISLINFAAKVTYVSAIAFVLASIFKNTKPVFGLIERLIYLGSALWIAVVYTNLFLDSW